MELLLQVCQASFPHARWGVEPNPVLALREPMVLLSAQLSVPPLELLDDQPGTGDPNTTLTLGCLGPSISPDACYP